MNFLLSVSSFDDGIKSRLDADDMLKLILWIGHRGTAKKLVFSVEPTMDWTKLDRNAGVE